MRQTINHTLLFLLAAFTIGMLAIVGPAAALVDRHASRFLLAEKGSSVAVLSWGEEASIGPLQGSAHDTPQVIITSTSASSPSPNVNGTAPAAAVGKPVGVVGDPIRDPVRRLVVALAVIGAAMCTL